MKKSNLSQVPVAKCLPRDDLANSLRFWCAFCKCWHLHGEGDGHRVAHCHDSPFNQGGYIVERFSDSELRNISKSIDRYFAQKKSEN